MKGSLQIRNQTLPPRLNVGEPHIIGPAVRVGLVMMRAAVIAAIDQHIAHARRAHLAEGDLLRIGRHAVIIARPNWGQFPS